MKDLITIFDASEKLGFNLDSLTIKEAIALKKEIIDSIEQAIINSDNK
ncbi:hypothetical protein Phi19:2_gp082 [Cellulophaga phage phi19:2]|uniref:Uncharacterized protein n=2 Tax=Cellulophaga phage phiST TaxID=756282 RepID=R9ZVW2_9CAUD|nr:hypothetical protein PhiST_gp082 [Cellulophaga phage phiST]AGO48717.1 hypothetical protein Phi19:2_gp082 [Cellulophaga phage phi19:2]